MKKKAILAGLLAALWLILIFGRNSAGAISPQRTAEKKEILIGGLFSLTGQWSNLGRNSRAALEEAVRFINEKLSKSSDQVRFKAVIEDTRLEPDTALKALKKLSGQGIKIFVGPQSSAEAQSLKPYADANGLILISTSSTAHSLALPGDNLFRFCPDDVHEGKAVAALMWQDGVRSFLSLGRYDAGNSGLEISTSTAFTELGGDLIGGVRYSPQVSDDFAAELQYLKAKSEQVKDPARGNPAVYLAGFDEVGRLLAQAGQDFPDLTELTWYGSDGAAASQAISGHQAAAAVAQKTVFPCPVFALDEQYASGWQPLAKKIKAKTRVEPDAFALSVYDAAIIAALAVLSVDATDDVEQIKLAIIREANGFAGVTGPTALNEAGDRLSGNYDFWGVRNGQWQKIAAYNAASREITREDNYRPALTGEKLYLALLDRCAGDVKTALARMDKDLAWAAFQLSSLGLSGAPARGILSQALQNNPLALDAITLDSQGIIREAEPEEYLSLVGQDISQQEQVIRLKQTKKPVMSRIIKTVEGIVGFDLQQPIFSETGKFSGAVSLLTRPDFFPQIIGPVIGSNPAEIMVLQTDGSIVYQLDTSKVKLMIKPGQNILTSDSYQPFPELVSLARTILERPEGAGLADPKQAIWKTVGLHGTELRLVLFYQVKSND